MQKRTMEDRANQSRGSTIPSPRIRRSPPLSLSLSTFRVAITRLLRERERMEFVSDVGGRREVGESTSKRKANQRKRARARRWSDGDLLFFVYFSSHLVSFFLLTLPTPLSFSLIMRIGHAGEPGLPREKQTEIEREREEKRERRGSESGN